MTTFDEFVRAGVWTPGERAFGAMFARRADASGDLLALTGALLLRRRAEGSSRVDLEAEAGRPFPDDAPCGTLPELDAWRAALAGAARLVAQGPGDAVAPLVHDGRHVALRRDVEAERDVARAILDRLGTHDVEVSARWREVLGEPSTSEPSAGQGDLFAADDVPLPDDQAVAAASALRHRVAVVTGGPGTGKTTTVAKILALWFDEHPEGRIALAAPTGKAAARLSSSIGEAAERLGLPADRVPRATTLHSLLSYHPGRDRFGADAAHPLIVDLVVVDEASMIDTGLAAALVRALPDAASLLLLGDADQLASVESGSVLADVVAAAAGHTDPGRPVDRERLAHKSADFAAWCTPRLGAAPPSDETLAEHGTLRDAVTCLRRVYRNTSADFAAFVDAVRIGDAARARAALVREGGAVTLESRDAPLEELVARRLPRWRERLAAGSPGRALALMRGFQWLCAVREDVGAVCALVDDALGADASAGGFYDGRPVLVTRNDRQTRLANGDVGVCWTDAEGRRLVWFDDDEGGEPRGVLLARMPEHEPAWALTVHKSQGSEYDDVVVLLPRDDHALVTRELVYTGVTRARSSATVVARPEAFDAALARRVHRSTGLADRLVDAG